MNELVFEVTQEADGGYVAECLTETIITQGDHWNELSANVREATAGYYSDSQTKLPSNLWLRSVNDKAGAVFFER